MFLRLLLLLLLYPPRALLQDGADGSKPGARPRDGVTRDLVLAFAIDSWPLVSQKRRNIPGNRPHFFSPPCQARVLM